MAESIDLTDFESESDLSGYDYPAEGQYHLVVHEVDDSRDKANAVYVGFTVLGGTTPRQVNKQFTERFADPDPSQKDGGKFCRKRQAKLLLATGVLTPAALGKANVSYDWQDMMFKQCKAAVTNYERKGTGDKADKVYRGAQIDGLDMWGPLDPVAEHIPHDQEAIAMARDAGQANVVSVMGAAKPESPAAAANDVKSRMAAGAAGSQTAQSAPAQPAADPYANL